MEIEINKNYHLDKLRTYLGYELSTSVLLFLCYFSGITILIMSAAALAFTPFMLKVLILERRYGWLILFTVIVLIPAGFIFIFAPGTGYEFALYLAILALFYFYCFLLRLAISDWIN